MTNEVYTHRLNSQLTNERGTYGVDINVSFFTDQEPEVTLTLSKGKDKIALSYDTLQEIYSIIQTAVTWG